MHGHQDAPGDDVPAPEIEYDASRGALIERFADTASDFGALDAESLAGIAL
ncbi:hypothetical protein [Luteimonas sp. FCS-9]|uniref:hypothetical protein n=1 Tax=Luteimonas sp. FCS-9 TaxID=1547516 RepID=UPI000B283026|nr:hypothetical protein [Luteimonas sp. FCS-9]